MRKPCCEREETVINKGAWSKHEDQKLIDYIKAHGEGCWRSIPKAAGLQRCGKSCRLRWINYLRPDIKRGNFGPDEEDLIIKLHALLGNRWSLIAGRLPGRTDNEVKNYWNSHIRKKLIRMGIDPNNHKPHHRLLVNIPPTASNPPPPPTNPTGSEVISTDSSSGEDDMSVDNNTSSQQRDDNTNIVVAKDIPTAAIAESGNPAVLDSKQVDLDLSISVPATNYPSSSQTPQGRKAATTTIMVVKKENDDDDDDGGSSSTTNNNNNNNNSTRDHHQQQQYFHQHQCSSEVVMTTACCLEVESPTLLLFR